MKGKQACSLQRLSLGLQGRRSFHMVTTVALALMLTRNGTSPRVSETVTSLESIPRKQAALSAGADTHPALLLRMTKEAQSPYWSIGGRQVTRAHGTFQGEQATNIAPPGYTTKPAMEWPSSLAITTALHVCVCSPHYTGSIRSVLIKQDNYNNTRKERRCVERNSPKVAKFGK